MLTDWELWAVANAVLNQHGDQARQFVTGRIEALAAEGDEGGVTAWQAIGRRMAILAGPPPGRLDA